MEMYEKGNGEEQKSASFSNPELKAGRNRGEDYYKSIRVRL
jgi:hypothetical protein